VAPLKKRYLPITIVTGILFLVALGGYLLPVESSGPPVRVLFENKGGKIVFNHADHIVTMDQECMACHHTTGNALNPPACSDCHVGKFDEAFAASHQETIDGKDCTSCHHTSSTIDNFSHADHENDYTDDCTACHHDESIEAKPQSCSNCHMDGGNSGLSLKEASHERCADCHEDMYLAGTKGCSNCHVREDSPDETVEPQACASCHDVSADQLIPVSMGAFHGKCMGCHEENAVGPYGDDACFRCHMQ